MINERNVLADLVTQKAQVEEVKQAVIQGVDILNEHHNESLAAWAAISQELGRLRLK
jgi:hypothetical protein